MYGGFQRCQGISRNWANGVNHANEQRGMLLSSQSFAICHLRILCAIVGRPSDVKGASFFLRNYRVSEFQVPAKIRLVEGLRTVDPLNIHPHPVPHTGLPLQQDMSLAVVSPASRAVSCCRYLDRGVNNPLCLCPRLEELYPD
jgi:hypothetical protein